MSIMDQTNNTNVSDREYLMQISQMNQPKKGRTPTNHIFEKRRQTFDQKFLNEQDDLPL